MSTAEQRTMKALNIHSVLEALKNICSVSNGILQYHHDISTDVVSISMNQVLLYKCQLDKENALRNLQNIKNALLELCPANSAMKIPNLPGCASRPSNVVRAFF